MSGFNVDGPIPTENLFPEATKVQAPVPKDLKKTEEIASRELGVVGKNSRVQGSVKNLFSSHTENLGKAIQEFTESIIQKLAEAKASFKALSLKSRSELQSNNEPKLQNILEEFKVVDKWISDFEEYEKPLDLNDPDSIMLHQQHVAEVRHGLQHIRDKAEKIKDPSVKADILSVADALMVRLDGLLTERFDNAEFFKGTAKVAQQPDEELANYFELEQFPEGEMPDEIPAAARDPFEELDQDLEELKGTDWVNWDYSEDDDTKKT